MSLYHLKTFSVFACVCAVPEIMIFFCGSTRKIFVVQNFEPVYVGTNAI